MRVVYKYDVQAVNNPITIAMPKGAQLLSLMEQQGHVRIWALVDPAADHIPHDLLVLGTGIEAPEVTTQRFVNSTIAGPFVWHLFDLGEGQ